MRYDVPHPIPYQGSKRLLAASILSFVRPGQFHRLVEPFAGSAAVTLAAAQRRLCSSYLLGDVLSPLAGLWRMILTDPQGLADHYADLWESQKNRPKERYNEIREAFNRDHGSPELLFLLARCVKNSVRFGKNGAFNQSPDNRRLGVRPRTERKEIVAAHRLLNGKCDVRCADFRTLLDQTTGEDIVYMDPPYQGVSEGRDSRYYRGVTRDEMIDAVSSLNRRGVQFLLSYDGSCGEKAYGVDLPKALARRVLLDAGRSSQATLSGMKRKTLEALYVSPGLAERVAVPDLIERSRQLNQTAFFG